GARDSPALSAADGGQLRRIESHSGESGAGGNGVARAGVAPAPGAAKSGKSRAHPRGTGVAGAGPTRDRGACPREIACSHRSLKDFSTRRRSTTKRNITGCSVI